MYYLDPLRCTHAVYFIVYRVINLSYVGVAVAARVAMNDKNTVKCHKKKPDRDRAGPGVEVATQGGRGVGSGRPRARDGRRRRGARDGVRTADSEHVLRGERDDAEGTGGDAEGCVVRKIGDSQGDRGTKERTRGERRRGRRMLRARDYWNCCDDWRGLEGD